MILNILKNSKSTLRLLILFLSLALFLFVKAQQTNDFKRCSPPPDQPDCKGLPNPPGTVCYNGWVPGEKTNCGSACPLSIYDNEIGYGRPWSKYIWETKCSMTYIPYFPYGGFFAIEQRHNKLGILLGIRQNQDVLTVVQEKLVI
jgi:hypothetical protein